MEAQFFGLGATERQRQENQEPRVYLVKARLKHEIIILVYRVVAMLIGAVLVVIGYLLLNAMITSTSAATDIMKWSRIVPAAVFAVTGLLFCILGFARLMPLPKFDKADTGNRSSRKKVFDDGIPVLAPLSVPRHQDKLWSNNVKPLMEKIVNNDSISSSDRELLRNWLKTV